MPQYGLFLYSQPGHGPIAVGTKRELERYGRNRMHPRLQFGGWEVKVVDPPIGPHRASRFWAFLGVLILIFVGFIIASCFTGGGL